jgi:hypothetical protein
MNERLNYLDIAEQRSHEGQFQVQLDIPSDSSLSSSDIERILRISSWDGDINTQIDGVEGQRSVLITKDEHRHDRDIQLKGLQISGVGYKPSPIISDATPLVPPHAGNFFDLEVGQRIQATTGMKAGKFVKETAAYAPTGAYGMEEWERKVKSTSTARKLSTSFYTPPIEAYGQYTDLQHDGENLRFLVFSIPDVNLRRFNPQFAHDFVDMPDYTGEVAMEHFAHVGTLLGKSARELHQNRFVHRQLHLGNFYYLKEQDNLFIMDWATMKPVSGSRRERAMLQMIDLVIPHQGFEYVTNELNPDFDYDTRAMLNIPTFHALLNGYGQCAINQTIDFYIDLEDGKYQSLVDWVSKQS